MAATTDFIEELMKRRYLSAAIAALAIGAAACSSTSSGEGELTEFSSVMVTMTGGSIQIQRTTGPAEWTAEATYSGEKPDFAPKVVDGTLVVDDGCGATSGCSVDYLISVPETTEVQVTGGSADVTIRSISAPVTVDTGSGVVFLNTVKGPISIVTGSGNIIGTRLEAASASFTSESGNIDVAFERVITDLTVDTESGNITAQLAGESYNLDVSAGGAVDLKIEDDDTSTNTIVLNTETGDLKVYKQ